MKSILRKTICLFVYISLITVARGQLRSLGSVASEGENAPGYFAVTNKGNELWVASHVFDSSTNGWKLRISKNEGLFWKHEYQQNSVPELDFNMHACFYKGNLYFNARFKQVTVGLVTFYNTNLLLKWNGSSLNVVDTITGGITGMDTFRNKLIISGPFTKAGYNNLSGLAEFDGSTWQAVGTPAAWVNFQPQTGLKGISQLVYQQGKLYITGGFNVVDGSKTKFYGIARYDGDTLMPLDSAEFTFRNFSQGELYALPDTNGYFANDSCFRTYFTGTLNGKLVLTNDRNGYSLQSATRHKFAYRNWQLYTLKASSKYPYANASVFIERFGLNYYIEKIHIPEYYRLESSANLGIFGKEAVFFMLYNTNNGQYEFLTIGENSDKLTISGKVYIDANNNCVYDAGDTRLAKTLLSLNPGNITAVTDDNGDYLFTGLEKTSYVLTLVKPPGKQKSCGGTGSFFVTLDSNEVYHFPLVLDTSYRDISVRLVSFRDERARRGFEEYYQVSVKNQSAEKRGGRIFLQLDPGFNSMVSGSSRLVFSGDRAILTFAKLAPDEQLTIRFSMRTNLNLKMNDSLRIFASLDTFSQDWDNNPGNDFDTAYLRIVSSYDPNDKISRPAGNVPVGTTRIQYHINFQNIGNDTAFNVVIVDTIDTRLSLDKIVVEGYSHPYKLKIAGNAFVFEFKNIKLVDSMTNEPGSKGFVRFSTYLDQGVPVGSKVFNRAYIYFDYNEAIITNTTMVRIHDGSDIVTIDGSKGLSIYPNPGSSVIIVKNHLEETGFTLYNAGGAVMIYGHLEKGANSIDIKALSPGIYMLRTTDGKGMARIVVE